MLAPERVVVIAHNVLWDLNDEIGQRVALVFTAFEASKVNLEG